MIISKITDGLGNQMFQYAHGKAIALKNNSTFHLDTSWYNNINSEYTHREFNLIDFKISATIASLKQIKKLSNPKYPIVLNSIYWRRQYALPYYKRNAVKEKGFEFDQNLFLVKQNAHFSGFWQSFRYFEQFRKDILQEFQLKDYLLDEIQDQIEQIKNAKNSVSLHVRLGDYERSSSTHYVLDQGYYKAAIKWINKDLKDLSIFVFSDDIERVKHIFKDQTNFNYVDQKYKPSQELYLMSICSNNIIANSSFSWWGAWLNKNELKIVVSPKKWFKNDLKKTKDLIPSSWRRI